MIFAVNHREMTLIEIFIVYLAIGAPFGVHYFLTRRAQYAVLPLIGRSLATALLWVFVVGSLVWQTARRGASLQTDLDAANDERIAKSINCLEAIFAGFAAQNEKQSFFDFREMLARYVGLTEVWRESAPNGLAFSHETELLRVAKREKNDLQLGGRCVHRRNVWRLQAHQLRAAAEFLIVCREFDGDESFQSAATDLAEQLSDDKTALELKKRRKKLSAERSQTEKKIWKTPNYEIAANLKIKA